MKKHRKVLSRIITDHTQLRDIRAWLHRHWNDEGKAIRIKVRIKKTKPLKGLIDSSEMVERFYWFIKPIWECQRTRVTIFEHEAPSDNVISVSP